MKTKLPLSLLFLCSVFLLLVTPPISAMTHYFPSATTASAVTATYPGGDTTFILTSCATTLYPDLCYHSLAGYANAVQQDPARLARVAIGVSLSKARFMAIYFSNISRQADYGANPRAAASIHDCFSVFGDAVGQMRGSLKQMSRLGGSTESVRFQLSNVQTWMSAALTNEDTCTDGFEDVQEGPLKTDVCDRVVKVKKVTSNALALVNSYVTKISPP